MSYTTSPNMSLIIPGVGSEPGPTYASDVNASLTIIDGHDHTQGSGVPITPLAININSTLNFQDNIAQGLQAVNLTVQSGDAASQSIYSKLGGESPIPLADLWYNDGTNIIQLTKAGAVNVAAASIPGESYAGGTFTWKQTQSSLPTTPANFDIGSVTIRPNTAGTTNGITLSPPSSISSAYSILLPALPGVNSFLAIDGSGNMTATIPISGGITGSNIASFTIAGSNIAHLTINGGPSGNIALNTITGGPTNSNIASETITSDNIALDTITGDRIASNTISTRNVVTGPSLGWGASIAPTASFASVSPAVNAIGFEGGQYQYMSDPAGNVVVTYSGVISITLNNNQVVSSGSFQMSVPISGSTNFGHSYAAYGTSSIVSHDSIVTNTSSGPTVVAVPSNYNLTFTYTATNGQNALSQLTIGFHVTYSYSP